MTQIKKNSEFQGPAIKPTRDSIASDETALAQRKDIAELYKRLSGALNSFNSNLSKGVAKKTVQDRAELVAKLDEVENAVNKMEGTLRIELEPMLRNLVAETVGQQNTHRPRLTARILGFVALFSAGLAVGISYPDQIKNASSAMIAKISDSRAGTQMVLPQNGGSQEAENQTE